MAIRKTIAVLVIISGASLAQVSESDVRKAATESITLLLNAAKSWSAKQSCPSCHHQDLPLMAFDRARRHGIAIDRDELSRILNRSLTTLGDLRNVDRALQGSEFLDPVTGIAGRLVTSASLGLPPSSSTGVIARLIARRQREDGHWMPGDNIRPPQSHSPFTGTAIALRTLQLFLPDTMAAERQSRIERAKSWLARTSPRDNEDRVNQLLGLHWAGNAAAEILVRKTELIAQQHPDGGWSQIPDLASDAYATGQALVALNEAAGVSTSGPIYQRGIRFLLETRKSDATWFVPSRLPIEAPLSPPYFDTGFPYGHDQFVSAMGTSWATAALVLSLPPSTVSPEPLDLSGLASSNLPAWCDTVLFGSLRDLRHLIDSGWNVNSLTAHDTSALMLAAPDAPKVSLLIRRGADPSARSTTGYTALMIAASHHATDSVRILLEHKAEGVPSGTKPAQFGASPLILAAFGGDRESMELLRKKGASFQTKMLPGGVFPVTPLSVAVMEGDTPMVETLLRGGVPVDAIAESSRVTSLGFAVFNNDTRTASLLLKHGAAIDHVDEPGYTPLLWAARINFGDSAMLELLLRAGANPDSRTKEGLTALQLATRYHYTRHIVILEKALAQRGGKIGYRTHSGRDQARTNMLGPSKARRYRSSLRSNGPIRRRAKPETGLERSYRLKLVETWLILQPLGQAWTKRPRGAMPDSTRMN